MVIIGHRWSLMTRHRSWNRFPHFISAEVGGLCKVVITEVRNYEDQCKRCSRDTREILNMVTYFAGLRVGNGMTPIGGPECTLMSAQKLNRTTRITHIDRL